MVSVIDRAQLVVLQQLGEFPRIDAIILTAFLQQSIAARIADYESRDAGLQQVVQPGGPGSFFESDMHVSMQPFHKLQDRARFRLDDSFHHNLAGSIPDRHRNAFLVHVHADIFSAASHKRVFLSGWFVASTQTLLQKGHPLYCVTGMGWRGKSRGRWGNQVSKRATLIWKPTRPPIRESSAKRGN